MTTDENGAPAGAERLTRVAALLQRYPDVSHHELSELKTWFKRQASALDIGILASKEEVGRGYALFREEHIDRFAGKDFATIVAALIALAGIIALIVYWTM
jgi:hypothetical protein